ncbi:hypothetical protein ASPWEDRAFT_34623 [Aspergillus wentii DTO 134E9]|uniref:Pentacotripeptide-repeat region of PRORP domain-containing protein n=1 Tax=Aspergillus wentii DTO 134E9 TaxID=1073089 RepID=A0A1L9S1W1_ASPWE|nr:uncharacterized protein ASPWEDRAFT_34623 [Aspergillus wentii DTO 134E9]KAI9930880.1 hypothetical protein MW887_010531 [Aspergillus wentii]OJJ41132.1 hypothetical protein ASPWEDRAFT_34623 [Aspergillus wentii DTO 134E9]
MPHSNRSQSSSNLRFQPPQGLDTSLLSRSSSMPNPDSSAYNASIRRLGPRRPRPAVASIADVFVGSLVMASFCREHSPRGRGLSTMSMNASREHMARWRRRNVGNSRQLSSKRCLEYLGSTTESLGMQNSRAQRMFNSGAIARVEEDDDEDNTRGRPWGEPSLESHGEDAESDTTKYLDTPSPFQLSTALPNNESMTDNSILLPDRNDTASSVISQGTASDDRSNSAPKTRTYRYHGKISPTAEKYASTSQLYRSTLGSKLNWKEAAEAVAQDMGIGSSVSRPKQVRDATANSIDAVDVLSVERFLEALWDEKKSNQYIFRLYRELPCPGVSHLSKRSRGALLRRFATPPNRRWVDARRYLALVEDMIAAKLPMSRSLWSSAIHLAGRASGKVFKRDLVRAIGIWQQMEHVAGVKSDDVVFTILFDIAIKASQFTVADRLIDEMTKRGIEFNREGKVSKMYYHGMRHDADGVRQTYDEFVSSGEIVDTVVLNCLLVSLIRAGEVKTADQLYHRMLQAQATVQKEIDFYGEQVAEHLPMLSSEFNIYRKRNKKLGKVLKISAALKDKLPEHHRTIQDALPMTPDTRTFHILLSFHAHQSGNLNGFMSVLGDMENAFAIPPRGMIYLLLFEGFAYHGGRKKYWSADRLREAWKTYLRALYESRNRLYHESRNRPSDRFSLRREPLVWENPLISGTASRVGKPALPSDMPSGLYTPLPLGKPAAKDEADKDQDEHIEKKGETNSEEAECSTNGEMVESHDDIDVDELFNDRLRNQQTPQDELEEMERQIENGVFLGRRMIIIILRAFGACCGPKEVMEVWLQIERIWQPWKRKALDVLAIKEELEKQMNRSRGYR